MVRKINIYIFSTNHTSARGGHLVGSIEINKALASARGGRLVISDKFNYTLWFVKLYLMITK